MMREVVVVVEVEHQNVSLEAGEVVVEVEH